MTTDVQSLILIDALNLAYWCGSPPSLRIPISLMTHLVAQGHSAILYFDASARYRLAHEVDVYERLILETRYCVVAPSGRTADTMMLKRATANDARIVSRDRYQDHRKRYRKLIDDPFRLLPGFVADDHIKVPLLTLDIPLPMSVGEAMQGWSSFMQRSPDRDLSDALHRLPIEILRSPK